MSITTLIFKKSDNSFVFAAEGKGMPSEFQTDDYVSVEEDGSIDPQGMDYSKLTPLLTAALQEAITKIETLETKVAALEGS